MERAVGVAIGIAGIAIATLGFVVMRDPMKLTAFSSGEAGYYQRAVLDRWRRIQLRIIGLMISLFGMMLASAVIGGVFKIGWLKAVSNGVLAELVVLFCVCFVFGVGQFVVQLARGEVPNWFEERMRGAVLGPIAVFADITPAMRKEASAFTVFFAVLVAVAVGSAVR